MRINYFTIDDSAQCLTVCKSIVIYDINKEYLQLLCSDGGSASLKIRALRSLRGELVLALMCPNLGIAIQDSRYSQENNEPRVFQHLSSLLNGIQKREKNKLLRGWDLQSETLHKVI